MDEHFQNLRRLAASEGSEDAWRRYAAALERAIPDGLRKVYLNSMSHYQINRRDGKLVLIEYGTGDPDDEWNADFDMCPGMEQRGPFKPEEGRVVEEFSENEAVEFIYSSFDGVVTPDLISDKIFCGDDVQYEWQFKKVDETEK